MIYNRIIVTYKAFMTYIASEVLLILGSRCVLYFYIKGVTFFDFQAEGSRFNRALLMNIGYAEAVKIHNYSCFIFHDVDLIPEHDHNIYGCSGNPRHMSAAVDKFNYRYQKYHSIIIDLL